MENLHEEKIKKPLYKKWWFWLIVLIFILVIIGSINEGSNLSNNNVNSSQSQSNTKEQYIAAIESLNKFESFDVSGLDKEALFTSAQSFLGFGGAVEKSQSSEDEEIKKLGKDLEKKLIAVQVKQLPLMRKAYFEIMRNTLWEENIDVSIMGDKNTILELVGVVFANNKNIKTFNDTISSSLKLLRYDQVRYRWVEGADGYSMDLESPKDNEVVSN